MRFGSVDHVGEEDELWGSWSSGRVLCVPRPTELDNDCGYGGDGGAGWGSGAQAGTADGRFDGGYSASPTGLSDGGAREGAFLFSAPSHPVTKAQTTRWTTGAVRRPPSADVRVIDAQRAGVEPLGPWGTVRTVLDPARPLAPPAAPASAGVQSGHGGPPVPAGDVLGAASVSPRSPIGPRRRITPGGTGCPRVRLRAITPLSGLFRRGGGLTRGDLIHFRFGMQDPVDVFGPAWGLEWMFPLGEWGIDRLLVHDLRWEHFVRPSPYGAGGARQVRPVGPPADFGANDRTAPRCWVRQVQHRCWRGVALRSVGDGLRLACPAPLARRRQAPDSDGGSWEPGLHVGCYKDGGRLWG